MEKTLANLKKQELKDKKRLEKIEKAGYLAQNAYLITQGFENLSKNLKALRKFKGDQDLAKENLGNKLKKKAEKLSCLSEEIKASKFEKKMDYLTSKGFKNIKKNFKYLTLYGGDQEKVLAHLSQSINKPSLEEKMKLLGYEKENKALVENGCSNLKKNLKLLQLYGGSVERVLDHCHHNKQHKYDQLMKLIEEKGFSKENHALLEKGFTKLRKNMKLLIKYKGDVSKVFDHYNQKLEEKTQELQLMCKTHGVLKEYQALVSKGYKPKKIVKLMKIYQWDAEKTRAHLESKKTKGSLFATQIKNLGYEEQNKVLMEKGFKHLKKNLKLLELNNGDLEKVLEGFHKKAHKGEKIEKKLEKLHFSKQYHELLAKDATLKTKKVMKALIKYNGDIDQAAKHLERKKLHKEFTFKEWNPQVHVVYLDGNNMLFVNENIRKLYLLNHKKEAEEMLIEISKTFSTKKQLEKVVLIFDKGNYPTKEVEIPLENNKKLTFILRCALEEKNSDDLLVVLTEKEEKLKNALFVTADLELRRRLVEKGVKFLMGPKEWFAFAKTDLGDKFDKIVKK